MVLRRKIVFAYSKNRVSKPLKLLYHRISGDLYSATERHKAKPIFHFSFVDCILVAMHEMAVKSQPYPV